MPERYFRIIIGVWIVVGLYFDSNEAIYALSLILLFEGLTNKRIPSLVSKLRYGSDWKYPLPPLSESRFGFEAERAFRFVIIPLIVVPLQSGFEVLWWLPWIIGFAVIGAGLGGICPMVMSLKYIGFR